MDQMCKQFDAIHDPRSRASEIGVCIYGKDPSGMNSGYFAPTGSL